MIEKNFTIQTERGMHVRPCHAFAVTANRYQCGVAVIHHGQRFRGKTSMHLMSAWIQQGEEITVVCDGADEADAMDAIEKLIESDFNEVNL